MVKRLMIQIEDEKCTGCGLCVPSCAEGALQIVDGKARVVSQSYCDGLGACLGHCPEDALHLLEVDTVEFDEEAAMAYVAKMRGETTTTGCPGEQTQVFHEEETHVPDGVVPTGPKQSFLQQWPVKLKLVAPQHPALKDSSLLILADCAAIAYAGLHEDFLQGKTVIQVCPKFENYEESVAKLTTIFASNPIQDISVVHMEVPCCGGLARFVDIALENSKADVPVRKFVIGVRGEIKAVY